MVNQVKFIKKHKPKVNSIELKSTVLLNGVFGIKALESGWLSIANFNALRHLMRRYMKKMAGRVWVRIFPKQYITKKSQGNARMGKGKAALHSLILYVKKGQILCEIINKGVKVWPGTRKEDKMFLILKEGIRKLPIKCKIQFYKK